VSFTVRYASTEADVLPLFEFLIAFHGEFGMGGMNPEKAVAHIHDVVMNHAAILVEDEAGRTVGSIGLFRTRLWYSDDVMLTDRWWFVLPEHRGKSAVVRLLLEEARDFAQAAELALVLWPTHSPKRSPRSEIETIGATLRYDPIGGVYRLR
jgi:hypothetical protein